MFSQNLLFFQIECFEKISKFFGIIQMKLTKGIENTIFETIKSIKKKCKETKILFNSKKNEIINLQNQKIDFQDRAAVILFYLFFI